MNIQADTQAEYLAATGEREPTLRVIDELIRRAAPHLEPVFFKSDYMAGLGYGLMSYQSKSMKEPAEWPMVMLVNQKNYISLYVCAIDKDGQYVAEKNASRLGKVSCGRSCIRFKKLEDLDLDVVREILSDVDARVVAGEKLFGL